MTTQNPDYGYDIQKLYLEIMLTDAETFVRCQTIFNSEYFDNRLKNTAEYINTYVSEHNILPTFEMVNASNHTDLKNPGQLHEQHYDWLLGEFETFCRHKALESAILKSADLLEQGEYGPVEDLVKRAVQISLQKDLGTDYWRSPRERLEAIKDKNGQVSTGWPTLDKKLYGGVNRGELNLFAGGSGSGKSLFLANLGVNWALAGMNVLYLTFELSENLVSMRIDSMVTEIPSRDIFKSIDDVEMRVKMIGKKSGAFQVKYMPTGKNANDLRSYIKEYEIKTGKRIDAVLVDYLDLMSPIASKISSENLFVKDKYVSEELRNLAMELNVVLVSAAQLNRCLTTNTMVFEKTKGKIKIGEVMEGDMILSSNGSYNKVLYKTKPTMQKIYKIKTRSGKEIRCTANHVFPTKDGEKSLSSGLGIGSVLYTNKGET